MGFEMDGIDSFRPGQPIADQDFGGNLRINKAQEDLILGNIPRVVREEMGYGVPAPVASPGSVRSEQGATITPAALSGTSELSKVISAIKQSVSSAAAPPAPASIPGSVEQPAVIPGTVKDDSLTEDDLLMRMLGGKRDEQGEQGTLPPQPAAVTAQPVGQNISYTKEQLEVIKNAIEYKEKAGTNISKVASEAKNRGLDISRVMSDLDSLTEKDMVDFWDLKFNRKPAPGPHLTNLPGPPGSINVRSVSTVSSKEEYRV